MDTTTTVAPAPDTICNIKPGGNTSYPDPFGLNLGNSFAGIPQNFIINSFIFLILITVFILLRKRGWGNVRIPLVGRRTNEWSSIFYGNRALELSASGTTVIPERGPQLTPSSESQHDFEKADSTLTPSSVVPDALSFRQWIKNSLLARDEFLLERSGPAAIEYLRFQRHVIGFTAVLCLISICIILPVNFLGGTMQSNMNSSFPRTTIANLDIKGDVLWIHVAFTMILFPMGLLAMLNYGMKFGIAKSMKKHVKTLMFYGLNPRITTEEKIRQHLEDAYPQCKVTAICLTLDVGKLQKLDEELSQANYALKYYQKSLSDERPLVKNAPCGFFCGCCVHGVDAIDYYQDRQAELERKIQEEVQSWKKTNPVFFVTFESEDQSYRVYKDYRSIFRNKPETSVSDLIGAKRWTCRWAPSPPFVSWENLSTNGVRWWARAVLINLCLFLLLLFISTPAYALNLVLSISGKVDWEWFKNFQALPLVSQFLPSLILLSVSGLIPLLIYYTVRWTGYHTRSGEMRTEMKLLFAFLLMAVLILPILALTSAEIIIETLAQGGSLMDMHWECAFLPDNGALFVNLMLLTGFVGAACQLLRIGQLFLFLCWYFCGSKSEAERDILLRTKTSFPFYEHYPDFLLSFSIVSVYCFVCPVVTPFGLFALCMKYLVDRYNLSYVFGRSEAPTSVHASAVNFFLVGILMQNFLMIFFFVIRGGVGSMGALLIAVMVINVLIYIGISWFGMLKKVSLSDEITEDDIDTPGSSPVGTPHKKMRATYIPNVLQRFEARHLSPVSNTVTSSTISA